jgi:hypothetical protein
MALFGHVDSIEHFQQEVEPEDDVTLVVVKIINR